MRCIMALLSDLVPEVKNLSNPDKIRLMQILVSEIALDAGLEPLVDGELYEIWSPYGADDAAATLLALLENHAPS